MASGRNTPGARTTSPSWRRSRPRSTRKDSSSARSAWASRGQSATSECGQLKPAAGPVRALPTESPPPGARILLPASLTKTRMRSRRRGPVHRCVQASVFDTLVSLERCIAVELKELIAVGWTYRLDLRARSLVVHCCEGLILIRTKSS